MLQVFGSMQLISSGSGGGRRGHDPHSGPVKISHKKDGPQRRPHRFYVSWFPLTRPLDQPLVNGNMMLLQTVVAKCVTMVEPWTTTHVPANVVHCTQETPVKRVSKHIMLRSWSSSASSASSSSSSSSSSSISQSSSLPFPSPLSSSLFSSSSPFVSPFYSLSSPPQIPFPSLL